MIEVDKQSTLDEFARRDTGLRIIVVTDALAHGKDIPDVDLVVVYGLSREKEPSILTQMFGKAARASGRKRIAVLVGDDWAVGDHDDRIRYPAVLEESQQGRGQSVSSAIPENELDSSSASGVRDMDTLMSKIAGKKKKKFNAERRAELPRVLCYLIMNTGGCLRQVIQKWLEEPPSPDHTTVTSTMSIRIGSDRDQKFTGAFWQNLFRRARVRLGITAAYHPSAYGPYERSERSNEIIETMLRCLLCQLPAESKWESLLPDVEFNLLTTPIASTGKTPFELLYGCKANTEFTTETTIPDSDDFIAERVRIRQEAADALQYAQAKMAYYYDQRRRPVELHDYVYVKLVRNPTGVGYALPGSTKLSPIKMGPFAIKRKVSNWAELGGRCNVRSTRGTDLQEGDPPGGSLLRDRMRHSLETTLPTHYLLCTRTGHVVI